MTGTRTFTPSPRGLRYRPDTGFELRCASCANRDDSGEGRWWPLDLEFWNPVKGLTRCRSCWAAREAQRVRERYRRDLTYRERRHLSAKRYQRIHRSVERIKNKAKWQAILADPVAHEKSKARAREATRRYRARKKAEALFVPLRRDVA